MADWTYIEANILAAWRVIRGRPGAMNGLDLSADGFWRSFMAMPVAAPALFLSWVSYRRFFDAAGAEPMSWPLYLAAMAAHDALTWVLPLVLLALAARPIGISDRFVPYVVANNWATVIFSYLLVPGPILVLTFPAAAGLSALVSLLAFGLVLALGYRVARISLDRTAGIALAIYLGLLVVGFALSSVLQNLFGLSVTR